MQHNRTHRAENRHPCFPRPSLAGSRSHDQIAPAALFVWSKAGAYWSNSDCTAEMTMCVRDRRAGSIVTTSSLPQYKRAENGLTVTLWCGAQPPIARISSALPCLRARIVCINDKNPHTLFATYPKCDGRQTKTGKIIASTIPHELLPRVEGGQPGVF